MLSNCVLIACFFALFGISKVIIPLCPIVSHWKKLGGK